MSSRDDGIVSLLRRFGKERIVLSANSGRSISLLEFHAVIFLISSLVCSCCFISSYVWGDMSSHLTRPAPTVSPKSKQAVTRTVAAAAAETPTPTATPAKTGTITYTPTAIITAPQILTTTPAGTPTFTATPLPTETAIPPPPPPPSPTPTSESPLPTPPLAQTPTPTRTPKPTRTPRPEKTTPAPASEQTPTPTQTPEGTPTPTNTPTPTDTPTPTPIPDLSIKRVEPGAGNYETEYVLIENEGAGSQDMTGWYLTDDDDHYYPFPKGFALPGGASVKVWTKQGTDTDTDLYWGRTGGIWGSSDVATLWDAKQNKVNTYRYP